MSMVAITVLGAALSVALALAAAYALWLVRAPLPARPRPTPEEDWPAIDVIVAVFNERALIQGKLENLSRLDYPAGRLRFFIVDGGSGDGSREMARAWTRHDERFLVLATAQPGKASQLNLGLRQARAPWILVTDVDARMRAETLLALMSAVRGNPDLGLIGCPVIPVNVHAAELMYWRVLNWLRFREWCRGSASMVMAPCYAFRRALIDQLPDDVVADDVHTAWRIGSLGYPIGLAGPVVHEVRGRTTVTGLLRQKVRRGAGILREMFRFLPATGGMLRPLRAALLVRLALFIMGPTVVLASVGAVFALLTAAPALEAGATVALALCMAALLIRPPEGSRVRRTIALLALLAVSATAALLLYPAFGRTGSFSLRAAGRLRKDP